MIDLRKTATKNRNYYLKEQKADDNENKWFRYVKTMDFYTEPLLISPKMAKAVLDISYLKKTEILNKNAISFNIAGNLLDGWSILEAIIANKKSAIVFVSFNVVSIRNYSR